MAILEVHVQAECDECGEEEVIELNDMDERKLVKKLEDMGWRRESRRHLCPDCIGKEEDDEE